MVWLYRIFYKKRLRSKDCKNCWSKHYGGKVKEIIVFSRDCSPRTKNFIYLHNQSLWTCDLHLVDWPGTHLNLRVSRQATGFSAAQTQCNTGHGPTGIKRSVTKYQNVYVHLKWNVNQIDIKMSWMIEMKQANQDWNIRFLSKLSLDFNIRQNKHFLYYVKFNLIHF